MLRSATRHQFSDAAVAHSVQGRPDIGLVPAFELFRDLPRREAGLIRPEEDLEDRLLQAAQVEGLNRGLARIVAGCIGPKFLSELNLDTSLLLEKRCDAFIVGSSSHGYQQYRQSRTMSSAYGKARTGTVCQEPFVKHS